MKENIAIFGAGTMANTYIDIILSQDKYNLVGLFDAKYPTLKKYGEYNVIGNEENLVEICKKENIKNIAVCIGDNYIRKVVIEKLKSINPNFIFPTLIHKTAYISKLAEIGEGSRIAAQTTIDGGVIIKDFCMIGPNSSLPHGSQMESYSSLAAGVSLSGEVNIGEFSFLGTGTNVSHGVNIGNNVVVGAGSTVLKEIPDNVVAYGVPAKIAHSRALGDKYL
jgi:sugar O-acyltransferase (sialic acid O-acetyltransferase NeuD family)